MNNIGVHLKQYFMKKTITLSLFVLVFIVHQSFAQVKVTGSTEYGRIFDLTYDANIPNKIYATTLGNHIVMSEDNGATWSILYTMDIVANAKIDQLKLSADGMALTFVILKQDTTENAVVVYDVTTMSVVNVIAIPNQLDYAYVRSYDFYDTNMNVLVIDTNFPVGYDTEGKTYYTSNGGITWDMIYYTNDFDTVFINKVAISPSNPNSLFLTRSSGSADVNGGLFISEDAGATFSEVLTGVVLDPITFDPSNDQTIFVGTGNNFDYSTENLYKSIDGGVTFNAIDITWTSSVLNNIITIKFNENNPSQIIVLEENEIAISEDGGATFQNIVYPNESPDSYYYGLNASYNPQNSDELVISSNYVPLFSNDGGLSVNTIANPYFVSTGTNDVFINDTSSNLYYGVQNGYIHRDLNNGQETSYNLLPLNAFTNESSSLFIDEYVANRVYSFNAGFIGGNLNVSTDNGVTNTQLLSTFSNRVSALATYSTNTETLLVAFAGYESTETQLKKIDFNDLNTVVITDIMLPTLDYINAIVIGVNGKITISLGTSVYVSEDDGLTWLNNSAGLEVLEATDIIYSLLEDPLTSGIFAMATSKGIFMSNDEGQTWTQKSTKRVDKIAFSTETVGAIVATTNSIFTTSYVLFELHYSTDYGETWDTISNNQLLSIEANSSSYKFNNDSVSVFVGTFDIGLIEYNINLEVLGVPELNDDLNRMSFFPNPTSGLLHVDLEDTTVTLVTIYTVSGTEVMDFKGISTLDVSNLSTGMYLLRVQDSSNAISYKRFVKQ